MIFKITSSRSRRARDLPPPVSRTQIANQYFTPLRFLSARSYNDFRVSRRINRYRSRIQTIGVDTIFRRINISHNKHRYLLKRGVAVVYRALFSDIIIHSSDFKIPINRIIVSSICRSCAVTRNRLSVGDKLERVGIRRFASEVRTEVALNRRCTIIAFTRSTAALKINSRRRKTSSFISVYPLARIRIALRE